MKTIFILTGLILSTSISFAANQTSVFVGEYAAETSVRLPLTKENCEAGSGKYDEDDNYCYYSEQNTVQIYQDELNTKVEISVIFGAGYTRDFSGYVTKVEGNVLTIDELSHEAEDYVSEKNGCQIKATFEAGVIVDMNLNDSCDPALNSVLGAKKVN